MDDDVSSVHADGGHNGIDANSSDLTPVSQTKYLKRVSGFCGAHREIYAIIALCTTYLQT
jgi:hypothetical protein